MFETLFHVFSIISGAAFVGLIVWVNRERRRQWAAMTPEELAAAEAQDRIDAQTW